MIGDSIVLTLSTGDSVVMDTMVVVDGAGEARTRALPAAQYTYRATHVGEDESIGRGRVESERHSFELLRQPAELSSGPSTGSERTLVGDRRPGRPLRTHPFPYLLIIALLSAEWIGRRRWGLR